MPHEGAEFQKCSEYMTAVRHVSESAARETEITFMAIKAIPAH